MTVATIVAVDGGTKLRIDSPLEPAQLLMALRAVTDTVLCRVVAESLKAAEPSMIVQPTLRGIE